MSAKTTGKRAKKTAIGKKDVPLSISKDVVNTKNRMTFGEDDDDNDVADDVDDSDDGVGKAAAVPAKKDRSGRVVKGRKADVKAEVADSKKTGGDEDDDDDDAPEVVQSGADEIKRLRELHEQMMLPTAKKVKKRRRAEETAAVGDNNDELDASILAVVGEAEASNADMTEEEENAPTRQKIIKEVRKSRKIGHIEVAILETKESIIDAFGMPPSAQEFADARAGRQPRTKFASFRSQKKLAPSKSFSNHRK